MFKCLDTEPVYHVLGWVITAIIAGAYFCLIAWFFR